MHRHALRTLSALAFTAALSAQAAGPTGLLNDTGQTQCNNGTAMVACDAVTTGDASARPRQDGRFGRDVASPVKIGGGAAGFDFTKVCMDGSINCATAANTTAVPAATDWACTKDNVTNLIWSLYSGLGEWTTYARITLPNADNAQSRCGYASGWRLPTRRELLSIVNGGTFNPGIDGSYFPATQAAYYWSRDPHYIRWDEAMVVNFLGYGSGGWQQTDSYYVRLVRSGQ